MLLGDIIILFWVRRLKILTLGEKILLFNPSTVIIKFLLHLKENGKSVELYMLQSQDREKSQKAVNILTDAGLKVTISSFTRIAKLSSDSPSDCMIH